MWIDSRMSVFKEPRRPSYSFKYHSLWSHIDLLHYLSKNANADLKHDKNANNQQLQYDLQFEMIFFWQLLKRNKGLHQVTTSTYLFGGNFAVLTYGIFVQ